MVTEKERDKFFNSLKSGEWVAFSHLSNSKPDYIAQFHIILDSRINWGLPENDRKHFSCNRIFFGALYTSAKADFTMLRRATPQELRMVGEGKVMFHEYEQDN